jgi:hypothetical protein
MPEELKDKTISCVDCRADFVFTAGEQKHFKEKSLYEPKRCKPCRDARRRAKQSQGG